MNSRTYLALFAYCLSAPAQPDWFQPPVEVEEDAPTKTEMERFKSNCLARTWSNDARDSRVNGRWIDETDTVRFRADRYGLFFTDTGFHCLTYEFRGGKRYIRFTGEGKWRTESDTLFLCAVFLKTVCECDENGNIDTVFSRDTTCYSWARYPYDLPSPDRWCWNWMEDIRGEGIWRVGGRTCFKRLGPANVPKRLILKNGQTPF
jgi:hypothetical protein